MDVGISPGRWNFAQKKEKEKRACLDVAFTAAAITLVGPLVVVRSTEILRPRTQMYLESRMLGPRAGIISEARMAQTFLLHDGC
jgi:hypothetical protein